LGKTNAALLVLKDLLAQDKILFKANQFLLVSHENNTKTNEKIIFLSNMVNMIRKKRYALYMRFLCVSIFFQKNTWRLN